MSKDIEQLRFIRLLMPECANLIPIRLLELVRDKLCTEERFMAHLPFMIANPFNIIGIYLDPENIVRGFLYFSINTLSEYVDVAMVSFDKDYHTLDAATKTMLFITKTIKEQVQTPKVQEILEATHTKLKPIIRFRTERPEGYKAMAEMKDPKTGETIGDNSNKVKESSLKIMEYTIKDWESNNVTV